MQTLYGAKGGSSTTSNLYTIDPATGVATSVGAIGYAITGLAFDPTTGTLYGVTSNNSTASKRSLITIDPATGAGTLVGALGLASNESCSDIAFDSAGQLYGWSSQAHELVSIDKATGAATPIGAGTGGGGGLSFTTADVLYHIAAAGQNIVTVNTSTGAKTNIVVMGAGPTGGGPSAAAFDETDVLYALWAAVGGTPTHLVTINVSTGVVTDIAATDSLMDGLAWSVVVPVAGRVLIAFDDPPLEPSPTWTRIDDTDNLVAGIDFHSGKQTERDRTDTGTASVYLNDTTGLFDPANVSSPYFGKLDGKQIMLQLWNPVTSAWVPQWRGFIDDYGYDINPATDPEGNLLVANIQVDCVDVFDYLGGYEVQPGIDGQTPPSGSEGTVFYGDATGATEDLVNTRIINALTDAGIDSTMWVVFSGNVALQGTKYDSGDPMLNVIRDAADAEGPFIANIYVDRFGRFVFHGSLARWDPDNVASGEWDFTRWKVGDGAAIALDGDRAQMRVLAYSRARSEIINSAISYPRGIDEAAIAGQVYEDATSIAAYGKHSWSATDLIINERVTTGNTVATIAPASVSPNVACAKYAELIVKNQKDPGTRIKTLTVKAIRPADARASATWGVLTGADISDIVNVKVGYPGGTGIDAVDFYIEGRTMRIRPLNPVHDYVELDLDVSPAEWSMDTHGVFA